jgi:hypothetical protein
VAGLTPRQLGEELDEHGSLEGIAAAHPELAEYLRGVQAAGDALRRSWEASTAMTRAMAGAADALSQQAQSQARARSRLATELAAVFAGINEAAREGMRVYRGARRGQERERRAGRRSRSHLQSVTLSKQIESAISDIRERLGELAGDVYCPPTVIAAPSCSS